MVSSDGILEIPKLLDLLMRGNYDSWINSIAIEDPCTIKIQQLSFPKSIKWVSLPNVHSTTRHVNYHHHQSNNFTHSIQSHQGIQHPICVNSKTTPSNIKSTFTQNFNHHWISKIVLSFTHMQSHANF